MSADDLATLKSNVDGIVRIISRDGESLLVRVVLVSEEDEDVVYELISSSGVAKYEKFDQQPAYRIRFQEIERVQPDDRPSRQLS